MHKWLLLALALVLTASLAGDVLLVHHHLSGFSVESEHNPPQYAPDFLNGLTSALTAHQGLLLDSGKPCNNINSNICYCCGWHNSAYLEGTASFVYSG